jgi:tetratricopeptide (TPR) repeat protein
MKSFKLIEKEADSADSLDLKGLNKYNLFLHLMGRDEGRQHAEDAIKYFNLSLKSTDSSDSRYFVTFSYLADIYSKLGQYENALNHYDQVLKLSSDKNDIVWALVGVASIYGLRKKLKLAEQYFNKAIDEASNTIATTKIYFDMARMYFENDCLSEADTAFSIALQKYENDVVLSGNKEYKLDILWYLGMIAYETGKDKDFVKLFKEIMLNIDNSHYYYANVHITLGHFYSIKNNYEKAREHYNIVLSAPYAIDEEIKMAKSCLSQIPLNA